MKPSDIDFIGIGAAKCGTTWLADMLRQHPDVFIPEKKELHYFNLKITEDPRLDNPNYFWSRSWYLKHFKKARPGVIKGEISPTYIWNENAAAAIAAFNPDVKIIALIRKPIDRALSDYLHQFRQGVIKEPTFEQAIGQRQHLLEQSTYCKNLKRYFKVFPPEQIKIAFYDDLLQDSAKFLLDIERFLGVREFIPVTFNKRVNERGQPKFMFINRIASNSRLFLRRKKWYLVIRLLRLFRFPELIRAVHSFNNSPLARKPEIENAPAIRRYFLEDISNLEKMTGRDLSHWK